MHYMEPTAPSLPLPEHLLNLAQDQGLAVEDGAVLFESDIGGGLIMHSWLSQQEPGICISTEILQPIAGSEVEYEELLATSMSEPVDEETAASVLERWGQLHRLELSFDAQKVSLRRLRKELDSGMENDNL